MSAESCIKVNQYKMLRDFPPAFLLMLGNSVRYQILLILLAAVHRVRAIQSIGMEILIGMLQPKWKDKGMLLVV